MCSNDINYNIWFAKNDDIYFLYIVVLYVYIILGLKKNLVLNNSIDL